MKALKILAVLLLVVVGVFHLMCLTLSMAVMRDIFVQILGEDVGPDYAIFAWMGVLRPFFVFSQMMMTWNTVPWIIYALIYLIPRLKPFHILQKAKHLLQLFTVCSCAFSFCMSLFLIMPYQVQCLVGNWTILPYEVYEYVQSALRACFIIQTLYLSLLVFVVGVRCKKPSGS